MKGIAVRMNMKIGIIAVMLFSMYYSYVNGWFGPDPVSYFVVGFFVLAIIRIMVL